MARGHADQHLSDDSAKQRLLGQGLERRQGHFVPRGAYAWPRDADLLSSEQDFARPRSRATRCAPTWGALPSSLWWK
jgi:hypothetical protein